VDGFATVTVCLAGLACEDGCGNLAILHNWQIPRKTNSPKLAHVRILRMYHMSTNQQMQMCTKNGEYLPLCCTWWQSTVPFPLVTSKNRSANPSLRGKNVWTRAEDAGITKRADEQHVDPPNDPIGPDSSSTPGPFHPFPLKNLSGLRANGTVARVRYPDGPCSWPSGQLWEILDRCRYSRWVPAGAIIHFTVAMPEVFLRSLVSYV
jgi:hypothetical protein